MKTIFKLIPCLFVLLSLDAYSATITTQVQKMSYSSYASIGASSNIDYSNDDLVYSFTANWDDVSSILNISVSDGWSAEFTDGYNMGSSESENVTIDVSDGQINSFTARNYYIDYTTMNSNTTRWVYDGNHLVRTYDQDLYYGMAYGSETLSYDVINPSAIPLPAGIYLFLSGLVGLGLMRSRNKLVCISKRIF